MGNGINRIRPYMQTFQSPPMLSTRNLRASSLLSRFLLYADLNPTHFRSRPPSPRPAPSSPHLTSSRHQHQAPPFSRAAPARPPCSHQSSRPRARPGGVVPGAELPALGLLSLHQRVAAPGTGTDRRRRFPATGLQPEESLHQRSDLAVPARLLPQRRR